mgnify:CR=1 FL=1
MKNKAIKLTLFLFAFASIYSCGKEEKVTLEPCRFGYEFFPAETGKYWVYKIDSTVYFQEGLNANTTTSYIRDQIMGEFIKDNSAEYVVARYFSRDGRSNWHWISTNVWNKDNQNFTITEGNLKFYKIGFPISPSQNFKSINFFDENVEFDIGGELVKVYKNWGRMAIVQLDDPCDESDDTFLTIRYADFDKLTEKRFVTEVYQKGIGMIERTEEIFDTQILNQELPWTEKVQKGYSLHKVLLDHN